MVVTLGEAIVGRLTKPAVQGSQLRAAVLSCLTPGQRLRHQINTSDDLLPCAAGFATSVDRSLRHERDCLRSCLFVPLLNVCWPWQYGND